jgi:signal transduction histidine kinase
MLAFARRQELKPETVDVARLVDGTAELLRRSLGSAVEIGPDFLDDLPAVPVDPNQLELAILNFAANASDAMPLGGRLAITARCGPSDLDAAGPGRTSGPYVCLAVPDTASAWTRRRSSGQRNRSSPPSAQARAPAWGFRW